MAVIRTSATTTEIERQGDRAAGSHAARAFTLAELMISIALVLLLMLGINQVFKVTGEAVGTNQAVSTGIRDARAAQAVLAGDFNAWAPDAPAIIVRSERVSAFRNRRDELADRDYDPNAAAGAIEFAKRTIDIDGDGIEGEPGVAGEIVAPAIYNDRSHRIDMLSFFGRGLFRRQTGGGFTTGTTTFEEYVADMSANEAWIWYGHLRRPDYTTPASALNQLEEFEHRDPGLQPVGTDRNANNFYASDWVLGRMAVLLVRGQDTDSDGIGDIIRDRSGREQRFIKRSLALTNDSVQPLRDDARSNDPGTAGQRWQLRSARYDLAGTDFNQFTQILENNIALAPSERWWESMGFRFQGDPTPQRPLTPANVARTTPSFLEHCSQFIVEYAGDFVEQSLGPGIHPVPAGQLFDVDGDGNVYQPDGVIDFIVENPGSANESRRIRWYGMPRDVSGPNGVPDGIIRSSLTASTANDLVDVVPLQDVLDTYAGSFVYVPPAGSPTNVFIERKLPRGSGPNDPQAEPPFGPPPANYAALAGGMVPNARYVAAWGPDTSDQPRPKLIRIVVTIDDPEGRIAEGQTFEYVFRVGG